MPDASELDLEAFRDVCFVIMPFGTKPVGTGDQEREVDFDFIFDNVFEPAINVVELPDAEGGGHLRAVRTDKEFHSGHISQDMFEYIEYSRFALADITGLNANVFYELGHRHRANESGTAVFRQADAPIPFDINQIKAFPYQYHPMEHVEESVALIAQVLQDSLQRNAWDSPIRLALRGQREKTASGDEQGADLESTLMAAENAVRADDLEAAAQHWKHAAELDPDNPLHELKASYWPKSQGNWDEAIGLLQSALAKEAKLGEGREESSYAEAYRELGIAQNKRDQEMFERAGEESLRKACHYGPDDFDAWSSLGGVLKRAGDAEGALAAYEKAVEVSNGHPYPLLNAIKLRASQAGKVEIDMKTMKMLGKAEGFREAQVQNDPPIDVPWSFFDLAEINLYSGEPDAALEVAGRGLELSTAHWMPGTFLDSLDLLPDDGSLDGLAELKAKAAERRDELAAAG